MPYCICDKCGYTADVPYTDQKCPGCHEGTMREMTKEQELIMKLRPLFREMKKETEALKQAVDTLYQSIKELCESVVRMDS